MLILEVYVEDLDLERRFGLEFKGYKEGVPVMVPVLVLRRSST